MILTSYSIFFILLSFTAFVSYIIIGMYILMLNPNNQLNKVFSIFCLALGIWSLAFLFFHASITKESCTFWLRISSIGYCTYFGLGLNFTFLLTKKDAFLQKRYALLVFHGPGLVFLYKSFTTNLAATDFVCQNGIWYQILPLTSIWYWLYIFFSVSYLFLSYILIVRWGKISPSMMEQKQAKTIFNFGIIPLLLGLCTNILLPALRIWQVPSMCDILMLSFILGIMYSIKKYQLMKLTPEIAANEILSKVIDMVILTDKNGKILSINESVTRILGYSKKHLLEKPIADIVCQKDLIIFNNKGLFSKNKQGSMFEITILSKTSLEIPVNVSFSNIYDNKVMLGMVYIIQDMRHIYQLRSEIEEKIKLTDSLIETNAKLKELDILKSDFLSTVSHELRTPINLILSVLQLMTLNMENADEHPCDEEKLKKHLAIMKQNCYRLTRLINNLIDVTKIDAGYFNLILTNNNIVSIVEEITLSIVEYVENKGINVIFDTDVEEKIIACDPDKIERIILNLISNAIKFTDIHGTIFVSILDKDSRISISIRDTGIGISKAKQSIIFERFMQVDNTLTRNKEGSGIGLSLVKSLVEMHNGTIRVESELGKGSEFIIELPVYNVPDNLMSIATTNGHLQGNIEKINIEFSDIYFH